MGTHWVPLGYIGAAGVTSGACRLLFGRSLELHDSILKPVGVTLDAYSIPIGCRGTPG